MTGSTDSPVPVDRRGFIALAGAGVAGGLAGCTGQDNTGETTTSGPEESTLTGTAVYGDEVQEGGRIVWGHSEVPQNIDPHNTLVASSGRVIDSIYEGLIGLTNDLELSTERDIQQPGLATDWTVSDDQLRYEITLREGVTFHDGSTLTSEDVKYSYERVINEPGVNANVFNTVDSIEAPDDRTVVINHDEVYQPFLRQLVFLGTSIVPEGSGDQLETQPIGTGPFKFESREQGNKIVMSAYDDYWGIGPYLDEVEERTFTSPTNRLTGVQSGDTDIINDIPMDKVQNVADSDDLKTYTWRAHNWCFLVLNTDKEPFDEASFRRGLDYLIDQEELAETALFGSGEATASPSFPSSTYRNNELEVRPQDIEMAQSEFDDSSYDPADYSLTYKVTTNWPWHVEQAKIIQQYFSEVGIDLEIQKMQYGQWLTDVFSKNDYDMADPSFYTFWEPAYMYQNVWGSEGSFNAWGYESDGYDETVRNALKAESQEEAINQFRELQRILHEDSPTIMLWFRDGSIAAKPRVNNLQTIRSPNHTYMDFGQTWVEEE